MNLRNDIIRLSDAVLAEARAAGLNPGGRLVARRGSRAARLYAEANAVRMNRLTGGRGLVSVERLLAAGWSVEGIREAASDDAGIRLLADRHRHLSSAYIRDQV